MRRNLNLVARNFHDIRDNFSNIAKLIKTERYTHLGNKPVLGIKALEKFYNLSRRNFAV